MDQLQVLLLFVVCLWLLTGFTTIHAQEHFGPTRQVQRYPLPAFSMLLKVRVDELQGDDDDEIYLDLENFQDTLERVTQLHLTDIFQQAEGRVEFDERFLRIQLSSKVRQDLAVEHSHTNNERVHIPLHAGFSGVVSYSFPQGVLPAEDRVEMLVRELLESALVAENYMLLFRRYLSSGVLADIEDVQDIRIGTELLNVAETPPPKEQEGAAHGQGSSGGGSNSGNKTNNNKKTKQLNAVTIVAIVIFLTLSCLLMLFGATVVLLMKDRAKQERTYNGQTMTSIGMGTEQQRKKASAHAKTQDDDDGDDDDDDNDNDDDDDDDRTTTTEETITPAWKRAVLPVLRKAIMVRRYWRKHIRKQRRSAAARKKNPADNPNEAASSSNAVLEDDDGLNDEDVYYDENLSDEEAAEQWLDAWQASITSIPVRTIASSRNGTGPGTGGSSPNKKHVKKKKASKMPLAPRPAKRQSKKAFLCCIAEEDSVVDTNSMMDPDDIEMAMSPRSALGGVGGVGGAAMVGSSPRHSSNNTTKICLELDRIQELASVIMEEEYPITTTTTPASPASTLSPTSVASPGSTPAPYHASNNASLSTSATFPGAYGNSSRKTRKHVIPGFDDAYDDDAYEGLERIQDVDLA